ncbi:MAG TPA: AAA family ATPase [Candidatus Saccharimonadales bacterium]|nr:AAA family ATPase [Candidatus Saccharimonadales bacterium]
MASVESEIVAWLAERPLWLQILATGIFRNRSIERSVLERLADDLISQTVAKPETPLTIADLPPSLSNGPRVDLLSVGDLVNVNALLPDQTLAFEPTGITLIYGDNASGKSGYARLVKEVAGARHQQPILVDAFDPSAERRPQSARIAYQVDDERQDGDWPNIADRRVRAIHFYDEACGDDYLVSDTEVAYRPSVLNLFDLLIEATDRLRGLLDERIAGMSTPEPLPQLEAGTGAERFLRSLTGSTPAEAIAMACTLEPNSETTLATLLQEEARLKTTDPGKEKARLTSAGRSLTNLANHIDTVSALLNDEAQQKLVAQRAHATELRAAAVLASSTTFASEPVPGVGTATWRAMWSAAERFVVAEASPNGENLDGQGLERCPLCQQGLDEVASDRLARFHRFIHDQTEQTARKVEAELAEAILAVKNTIVSTAATTTALQVLEAENQPLANQVRTWLGHAEEAQRRLLAFLEGEDATELAPLPPLVSDPVRAVAANVEVRAGRIDGTEFAAQMKGVTDQRRELAARVELSRAKEALEKEVRRLRIVESMTATRNSITTAKITQKSTELTRNYVTSKVNDQFVRECERLQLTKVTLSDKGVKGKLRQRPSLLGVKSKSTPRDVLSEGEQTALGLAGLLTELAFDASKSAVVLDDPVSSLSHARRNDVAKRVVEVAKDRQVIVFTHDLTFLGYLTKAAKVAGVPIAERSIERTTEDVPGQIYANHPWKAKDVPARIQNLRQDLAKIKREKKDWSQEEYLREVSGWAGCLSETYERIVSSEIANKIFDRGTAEVKTLMFRILPKITEQDNTDFQDGFNEVSEWARRHDKTEETNFVPPTVEQLQNAVDRAEALFKRIKSYGNQN